MKNTINRTEEILIIKNSIRKLELNYQGRVMSQQIKSEIIAYRVELTRLQNVK